MNLKMRVMKVIKKGLYLTQKELLCILTSRGLNKMGDFIRYFIKEMAKEVIELTYVAMVNILKYVPGFQGVDEAVSIKPRYLTFVPDRLKTQDMCSEAVRKDAYILGDVSDHFKTQEMRKRVLRKTQEC